MQVHDSFYTNLGSWIAYMCAKEYILHNQLMFYRIMVKKFDSQLTEVNTSTEKSFHGRTKDSNLQL